MDFNSKHVTTKQFEQSKSSMSDLLLDLSVPVSQTMLRNFFGINACFNVDNLLREGKDACSSL